MQELNPQGYNYGRDPKNTNPFFTWLTDDEPTPVQDMPVYTPKVTETEDGASISWTAEILNESEPPEPVTIKNGEKGDTGEAGPTSLFFQDGLINKLDLNGTEPVFLYEQPNNLNVYNNLIFSIFNSQNTIWLLTLNTIQEYIINNPNKNNYDSYYFNTIGCLFRNSTVSNVTKEIRLKSNNIVSGKKQIFSNYLIFSIDNNYLQSNFIPNASLPTTSTSYNQYLKLTELIPSDYANTCPIYTNNLILNFTNVELPQSQVEFRNFIIRTLSFSLNKKLYVTQEIYNQLQTTTKTVIESNSIEIKIFEGFDKL